MNEIMIFKIEGSSEVFIKKGFVTDVLLSELPDKVVNLYELWRKQTNLDGEGLTIKVWYNDFTYRFTNHYWD